MKLGRWFAGLASFGAVMCGALMFGGMMCGVMIFTASASAQGTSANAVVIDATATDAAPGPANYTYDETDAKSPDGHVLGLNARYLTLDGKPWLPVMGEMHYSRVPEAEWEEQILKMKSAGVNIIAAYIIWIHHEEVEGEWDWQGQKDLRKFALLCQKHGMYLVPRIGPWSHAEVRNGGFPDWVMEKAKNQRQNDPTYLGFVDAYFKQIATQLQGLMYRDGGPVVAIQLENEYRGHGTLGGTGHILKLKQMAREDGFKVPFYTVTEWDGASVPVGQVLPVGGGYPDAPWDSSITPQAPSGVYAFHIRDRAALDMGAQNGAPAEGGSMVDIATRPRSTPNIVVEMGGGMQITYHRRPVVSADDVVAMAPAMLGSGTNLYGSYMFQGGQNPEGKRTTLQESLATHAPNDMPVRTYDFEAFLGEFGDERPSLMKEKSWNYFMNDFGGELAPMTPRRPQAMPTGPADVSVVRVAARTSGASGFVFVNNHARGQSLPARTNFQVEVKLPGGASVKMPETPVTVAADSYFVWPFGEALGGLKLRYATAQPFAKLGTTSAPVYAFFAQPGIAPEFVIEDTAGLKLDRTAGVERRDGAVWVRGVTPGPDATVRFTLGDGSTVTLLVLRQQDAEQSWKIASGPAKELVLTPEQAYVDGDAVTLENFGGKDFNARVLGGSAVRLVAAEPKVKLTRSGDAVTTMAGPSGPATMPLAAKVTKAAGDLPPLPAGFKPSNRPRMVAAMPKEDDWTRAGMWTVALPKTPPASGEKRFLRIKYVGDVMRLNAGGKLLDDNFADGRPWLVGLTRFAPELKTSELQVQIYPLRKDAPVFFEPGLEMKVDGAQADRLESVELVTETSVKLKLEAAGK